ncbi:MAG: hypothetical protein JNL18_04965 [Planctomycetaceae bacterium]|nr:hypothetical protein [Planctomycetaceae bacterium]
MFAFLLLLAVVGEAPDDDATIAKGFDKSMPVDAISAPVHYEDSILIVTTKQGVAAIQFTKPIDNEGRTGLEYQYRFFEEGKTEQTGKGDVFTRARDMLPEERLAKGLDAKTDEPQPPNKTFEPAKLNLYGVRELRGNATSTTLQKSQEYNLRPGRRQLCLQCFNCQERRLRRSRYSGMI